MERSAGWLKLSNKVTDRRTGRLGKLKSVPIPALSYNNAIELHLHCTRMRCDGVIRVVRHLVRKGKGDV